MSDTAFFDGTPFREPGRSSVPTWKVLGTRLGQACYVLVQGPNPDYACSLAMEKWRMERVARVRQVQ